MELFGLDEKTTKKVIENLAVTSPYGVVQEDCEMYLVGMIDNLSDATMGILESEKDAIVNFGKNIEELGAEGE